MGNDPLISLAFGRVILQASFFLFSAIPTVTVLQPMNLFMDFLSLRESERVVDSWLLFLVGVSLESDFSNSVWTGKVFFYLAFDLFSYRSTDSVERISLYARRGCV